MTRATFDSVKHLGSRGVGGMGAVHPRMTDFTPLSIHDGYGSVHLNRFRISVRAPRDSGQIASIGRALMGNMPRYMAASTASAQLSDRTWNGQPTLRFRGVARIRPFSVITTLPIPGIPIPIPVPARIRDWMAPDLHTDCVGLVVQHGTGFTVQTLKRRFEDEDDATIRSAVLGVVAAAAALLPVAAPLVPIVARKLADIAVDINQHHFLAGRRGFRFDVGSSFGYRDGRVVFETVAIERFSHAAFAHSQLAVGSIPDMVREVWGEMLTRFCKHHGLTPITGEAPGVGWSRWGDAVHCMQTEVPPSVAAIQSNVHVPTMQAEHQQLLEPRP